MLSPDFTRHPWNGIRMAASIQSDAGIVEVDTFQGSRQPVRIAFAPHFTIGDYVEPGAFLIANGKQSCIILCLFEPFRSDPPEFASPHAGWKSSSQFFTVYQPIGLRIRANQSGW
jgi:hypothetical protein